MATTSTRFGARVPDLTDPADAHADWLSAINTIDGLAAIFLKGTFASRPAAGTVSGKFYYATDTAALYVTDGTTWQLLNPFPATDAAVGIGSLRTLGAGALQAAAGNDSRLSDTRTPTPGSVVAASIAAGAVSLAKLGFLTTGLVPVGTVGAVNGETNMRAGRQLARTDFTTVLGLTEPSLLMNCSAVSDQSVNARTVTNTGLLTGRFGVEGIATTALEAPTASYAQITNAVKQKYGSWGGWFKLSTRKQQSQLFGMWQSSGTDDSMKCEVMADGTCRATVSTGGGPLVGNYSQGNTIIDDGLWHFIVMTWDGTQLALYVDGQLDSDESITNAIANNNIGGPLNQSATMTYGLMASASGSSTTIGFCDEHFITTDVLAESHVRFLYAKKVPHALGTVPELYVLKIRKYARSNTYVATDFTTTWNVTQPSVGCNMRGATFTNDFGIGVLNPGTFTGVSVDGRAPDGVGTAWFFNGGATSFIGNDSSFQTGNNPMTIAVWVKANRNNSRSTVWAYGTVAGAAGRQCDLLTDGSLTVYGTGAVATSQVIAPGIADGYWHHVVFVESSAKWLYVDGVLVDYTAVPGVAPILGGTTGFRLGQDLAGANFFTGYMGGFFDLRVAYPATLMAAMWQKQTLLIHNEEQLEPFDYVEQADNSNIYAIFDQLEETDKMELMCL